MPVQRSCASSPEAVITESASLHGNPPDLRTLEIFEKSAGQWLLLTVLENAAAVSSPPVFRSMCFGLIDGTARRSVSADFWLRPLRIALSG